MSYYDSHFFLTCRKQDVDVFQKKLEKYLFFWEGDFSEFFWSSKSVCSDEVEFKIGSFFKLTPKQISALSEAAKSSSENLDLADFFEENFDLEIGDLAFDAVEVSKIFPDLPKRPFSLTTYETSKELFGGSCIPGCGLVLRSEAVKPGVESISVQTIFAEIDLEKFRADDFYLDQNFFEVISGYKNHLTTFKVKFSEKMEVDIYAVEKGQQKRGGGKLFVASSNNNFRADWLNNIEDLNNFLRELLKR